MATEDYDVRPTPTHQSSFLRHQRRAGTVPAKTTNKAEEVAQEGKTLPSAKARRYVAGGMADRVAAAIRPRAKVLPQECRRRSDLLRVRGNKPANARHLSGPSSRQPPWRQLLFLSRFRHEYT